jgi:hypothetical protein
MLDLEDITYLEWLFNRLLYKYRDNPIYINKTKDILQKIKNPQVDINDTSLDKILAKYFIDFNLDKEDNIGYNNEDRIRLRLTIRSIIKDIVTNNIPDDTQIPIN